MKFSIFNFQFSINFQILKSKTILVFVFFGLLLGAVFLVFFKLNGLNIKERKEVVNPVITPIEKKISGFGEEDFKIKPLTLQNVFAEDHSFLATLPASRVRTLIVTGDIILGRMVNFKMVTAKDFILPFKKTADFLRSGDITFSNFESPLIKDCKPTTEGMIFCGDKRGIEGLTFSGIDIVSLANNHMANFGVEGIKETEEILGKNNIGFVGTNISGEGSCLAFSPKNTHKGTPSWGSPYASHPSQLTKSTNCSNSFFINNVKGLKFGFLGYNFVGGKTEGVSGGDKEEVKKEILEAKPKVDILAVMFHWGEEYTASPSAEQRELSHLAIENGADLVLGNHPHWVQGTEIFNGKFITYSHGNFIFDQEWSRETKEGVIGKYTFYDKELVDAQFFPILIEDFSQPKFLNLTEGKVVLKRMEDSSKFLISN